ncbi:MAG: fatty acid--CoA ligase family protein [Verrucomicrobiota bacterium]|jgi:acyl-coenzyme A synthetase/AMP-(fatty) acid ligase
MLYERWRQIVRERSGQCALRDLSSDRQWTFAEIARLVEGTPAASRKVIFPRGHDAGFVFAVLQAWRSNSVVCPMEADQTTAQVMGLPPAHCLHLKTTSATTGAPRFVAFTPEQLAADAENIVSTMGLRPDWPNVAAISLAHSYGFSNLVLPLLLHGIPLFIAPSPLPEIFRQAIKRAIVSDLTLPAVPALWRAWHAAGVIPAQVRLAISAGAPLPLALETHVFSATGIKIHNFYGSSECGGIAYDATPVPRTEESCTGKPMRNVDLQIGDAGCLEVRGKAVGETYWPTPSSVLKAGCFQTSDLAEIINGEVYLRGRLADQINVAGRKVSPAAIERALLEHDQVADCLAFGVPSADADRAEVIVACIVAKSPLTGEELKQFLLRKIPAWQIPREWWFVDSLDCNHLGKISRAQWRQDFLKRKESVSSHSDQKGILP